MLPDPKQFATELVARINAATAPTRGRVAKLEAEVRALRSEVALLKDAQRRASASRPRTAA